MKKAFAVMALAAIFFVNISFAQNVKYERVDETYLYKNPNMKEQARVYFFDPVKSYFFNEFVGNYVNERKSAKNREEAMRRLNTLKERFSAFESYPESITDGWHNVIMTDNINFCTDAKVLVSNNRVKELVADDYLRIECTSTGPIKKGKNVVTLKDFKSEFDMLDVYFIYDIDEPQVTSEPKQPGYVCFWSSKKGYLNKKIIINGMVAEGLLQNHSKEPMCLQDDVRVFILKPGNYKYLAQKSGSDQDGILEVKSGMCLKVKLD